MVWYFAYGSNNIKQLKKRLNVKVLNVYPAILHNYSRTYIGYSDKWNSSVATLIPSKNSFVIGSITNLTEKQINILDSYEKNYQKIDIQPIIVASNETYYKIKAITYIYNQDNLILYKTSNKYLKACYDNLSNVWDIKSFNSWKKKEKYI